LALFPAFWTPADKNIRLTQKRKESRTARMITVKSTQKLFTEQEISRLTGICEEHLRALARSKHLGSLERAAGTVESGAERLLFTNTDLSVLSALFPRCEH
jgi:hypothetical protein